MPVGATGSCTLVGIAGVMGSVAAVTNVDGGGGVGGGGAPQELRADRGAKSGLFTRAAVPRGASGWQTAGCLRAEGGGWASASRARGAKAE
mmetsp:Transcript_102687/g.331345  ORF Transcript_102687/g.331345 Transcript_102687/m.331345 type:complete len:91 (+) Transcript_102687:727-999(+)